MKNFDVIIGSNLGAGPICSSKRFLPIPDKKERRHFVPNFPFKQTYLKDDDEVTNYFKEKGLEKTER